MRSAGKGRFSGQANPLAAKFSRSVHFDQRLARYDLRGKPRSRHDVGTGSGY